MDLECVESPCPDAPTTSELLRATHAPSAAPSSASAPTNNHSPPIEQSPIARLSSKPAFPTRRTCCTPPKRAPTPSSKRPRHAVAVDVSASVTRLGPTLASLVARDAHTTPCAAHLQGSAVTVRMREEVVAWCTRITEDLRIAPGVVSVAVNLFDRFVMRQRDVRTTVLYPLTAACLLLATKLVEDGRAPIVAIAERAQSPVPDVRAMERVVLNVLDWRVHVATPLEAAEELADRFDVDDEAAAAAQRPLRETLLLHALADYDVAWMRATSVGTGCFLLAATLSDGAIVDGVANVAAVRQHAAFEYARSCGVNMREVEQCVGCLLAEVDWLLDECGDIESDCSEDDGDEAET